MKYGLPITRKRSFFTSFLKQTRVIALSFAVVIAVGALLLMLPAASKGERLGFVDALFTAASATCVTGLATVPVSSLTAGGQAIVLLLIQIGGMGFMTLASATFVMMGKRFSLREKLNMREYLSESDMSGLNRLAINVVRMTLVIEAAGAAVLTVCFGLDYGFGYGLWYGVFHAVSAFCNAGLDILPEGAGFLTYAHNPAVLITLSLLIILGGLGFIAIGDALKTRKLSRMRTDTKIVYAMSGALLLLGTVVFLAAEYSNPATIGGMNFWDKLVNCFFFSASTRTAGFSSFAVGAMRPAARNFTIMLMFIGASPGSTGGGIKTTTAFVLIVWVISHIRNRRAVVSMRKVGSEVRAKAASIIVLAIAVIAAAQTLLLAFGGPFTFEEFLFETVSAYATVGLSMGITAGLTAGGKTIIVFIMFMGRVGAYTLLAAATRQSREPESVTYPELNLMM